MRERMSRSSTSMAVIMAITAYSSRKKSTLTWANRAAA